ncbi:molybdate transport system substrate-binding protein [Antricoccus suffuscus]|uniref:Molybdate transport system substrate-binding protein n=1 Tax=Antricoccus suffuscus TaxID=1629062 RepID=A0A2T0ZWV8_9ACTN|nr:molybdate ABC transporter substrate-binding protein [Antricoccus suffuscus]PRZ40568.1 molybdate transport system substrate-binding protein [Antricoccus suffuscus]
MRRRTTLAIAAIAALTTLVGGCSSSKDSGSASSNSNDSSASKVTGTITVLAAASLTESFDTIAKSFEKANPGTTVKISYGGSSALAEQINQDAPVDVFASASTKNMTAVTDTGKAETPTTFVQNKMQIAVPASNPAKITKLADLAKPDVKVALCQPQVPCGVTAAKVFTNAGLKVTPVTLEQDVKSTLTKVELNEADAAVVYVTDVKAAGDKIKGIEIPDDVNATTDYPIATMKKAPNADGAKAFMDYVLSADGIKVLEKAGFAKP